ncbi:Origin recognition complex subunit 2 [Paramarasmius palmivorus]|uniref:Origin recognition complex subunit 2 n=1 Tax=Paramarasmius palmivorus TaxID=297713 RepID=A0AAW0E9A5_9AGAR
MASTAKDSSGSSGSPTPRQQFDVEVESVHESIGSIDRPPSQGSTHLPLPASKTYHPFSIHVIALLIPSSIFGVLARLGLQALVTYDGESIFPLAFVQALGCFVMGAALPLKPIIGEFYGPLYIAITTGFCGSLTTFSSWQVDVFDSWINSGGAHRGGLRDSNHEQFIDGLTKTVFTLSLSLSSIIFGSYLAKLGEPYIPRLSPPKRVVRWSITVISILLYAATLPTYFRLSPRFRHQATAALLFAFPGALTRYILSVKLNPLVQTLPIGTFTANAGGTALLAAFHVLQAISTKPVSPTTCSILQGLGDGYCGCLTTVSTFAAEVIALHRLWEKTSVRVFVMNHHDPDASSSGDEDDDQLLESSSEDEDNDLESSPTNSPSKSKKSFLKTQASSDTKGIIVQTSFDAYFTHAASRAQTSNNIYSSLITPLSAEEYAEATAGLSKQPLKSDILTEPSRSALFSRLMLQLRAGFNILCYGFGSKRRLLNEFAVERCSKAGHVVVANGFQPDFNFKEMLRAVENVPGFSSFSSQTSSNSVESQVQRIREFFNQHASKKGHLYIVIHNIDSPILRAPKTQSLLATLAQSPGIHIIASIDHINAPLIWSSSQLSGQVSTTEDDSDNPIQGLSSNGFRWLWNDLTTLTSYDFELRFADRTSLSGAHDGGTRKQRLEAGVAAAALSETAALHVLASVTVKAKKLFVLVGTRQLQAMEDAGIVDVTASSEDYQQYAIGYDALFNMARDNFVATNDTGLRGVLGEFRDHSLIVGSQGGSSGEMLWIPLRKERLEKVINKLKSEGGQ